MIYLASPYSDPDELVRKTRFLLAEQVTAYLLKERRWTYSPIVHCHELATKFNLPTDFEYWKMYNLDMLRRCEEMYVLKIPGWDLSRGVKAERLIAYGLGMTIRFITDQGFFTDGENN